MKNRKILRFYPLILLASLIIVAVGCKKKFTDIPTVVTNEVIMTAASTANAGGTVTSDGGTEMTARGVVWCQGHAPTLADFWTFDGAQTGTFFSKITGLQPHITYNVRAFATNRFGTAYGKTVTITTGP
jgi:hypothetical protein